MVGAYTAKRNNMLDIKTLIDMGLERNMIVLDIKSEDNIMTERLIMLAERTMLENSRAESQITDIYYPYFVILNRNLEELKKDMYDIKFHEIKWDDYKVYKDQYLKTGMFPYGKEDLIIAVDSRKEFTSKDLNKVLLLAC